MSWGTIVHRLIFSLFFILQLDPIAIAAPLTPDWSKDAKIDTSGRPNPYGWDELTLKEKVKAGKLHALNYPVTPTGILVPARPTFKALDAEPGTPLFIFLKTLLSLNSDFRDFKGFWKWLGLVDYPDNDQEIPYPQSVKPDYPMGVSFVKRGSIEGITFSCAGCHASSLFGKPILGLSNRFPQENLFFEYAGKAFHGFKPGVFAFLTGATPEEKEMYRESREKIISVQSLRPQALGLDTSLAQVALSLAKRAQTPWAERTSENATHPRADLLDQKRADSKPAVWWNVKYKTHFLSDGSVQSGNPVFTNFLWNEIGRGADLPEIDQWLSQNDSVVEELTTAVFATQAPRWKNYLSESAIHLERAKKGESLFLAACARCHGTYTKAWSLAENEFIKERSKNPELSLIDTIKVNYKTQTTTKNVGTDLGRAEGMESLARALNPLAFSQKYGVVIEPQDGYVPPPLEGIWARFPYLHNNSIPNLCVLMTEPSKRPKRYVSGEPLSPDLDYDQTCVGYPIGDQTPSAWKTSQHLKLHTFNTQLEGLSNQGHYEGIFTDEKGAEKFTSDQKQDLIEFLKTL